VKNYCALGPLLAGPTEAGLPAPERNRGGRGALAAGARAMVAPADSGGRRLEWVGEMAEMHADGSGV
jgi:hypothetical protein